MPAMPAAFTMPQTVPAVPGVLAMLSAPAMPAVLAMLAMLRQCQFEPNCSHLS